MCQPDVGANLMFALRTTIVCEPMPEAYVSNSFSNIGLILVFVRRANIRFAPTLVLLIGLILVFVRGQHKVRQTRRITKYLLRSTRKFMIAYLFTGFFVIKYENVWSRQLPRSYILAWLQFHVKRKIREEKGTSMILCFSLKVSTSCRLKHKIIDVHLLIFLVLYLFRCPKYHKGWSFHQKSLENHGLDRLLIFVCTVGEEIGTPLTY